MRLHGLEGSVRPETGPAGKAIRFIGLTGGIATGKSTASRCFREAGFHVIDADEVARRAVEPGSDAAGAIRRTFGDDVLRSDGSLDRKTLGERVFRDPEARARLNAIVHPRVEAMVQREVQETLRENPRAVVVYDVPLLFETGMEDRFDLVVLVYAPRWLQLERLMRRDGLGKADAEKRLAAQMDIEEKVARADEVLDNRGTLEDLRRQVRELARGIRSCNRKTKRPEDP